MGDKKTDDVVWKVIDGSVNVSSDRKTLTAGDAGTAVVWAGAAGNENIGIPFTVEVLDSLADMVRVTFNEDERYTLTASLDGKETAVPCSGYLVKKGSALTVTPAQQNPEVISLVIAILEPVKPGCLMNRSAETLN